MRGVVGLLVLASCGRIGFGEVGTTGDANGGDIDAVDAIPACGIVLGAGRQHTTALFADGFVRVWGYGMYGQIGDGMTMDRNTPTTIALPARVVSASGGRYETCVALETGRVMCWGEGDSGQLGDGNGVTSAMPVIAANLTTAVEVAAAAVHSCARLGNGEIWCWGDGAMGRLGTGNSNASLVPVRTINISTAKKLVAGGSTSCAILADDTLRCWGYNLEGEVGNNTTMHQTSPVEPLTIGTVRSVSTRDRTTCAARKSDGALFCFGANDLGQACTGVVGGNLLVPTQAVTQTSDLVGVDEVGQGIEHGCARVGTDVWCWGRNDDGQLGDGSAITGHPYATQVPGLPPVIALGIAAYTSCAITAAGAVWCWGRGLEGELGNGTFTFAQTTPIQSFAICP